LKACCQYNNVELCFYTIAANDSCLIKGLDPLRNDLYLGIAQSFQVVGVDDPPLASLKVISSIKRLDRITHLEGNLALEPYDIFEVLGHRYTALHAPRQYFGVLLPLIQACM